MERMVIGMHFQERERNSGREIERQRDKKRERVREKVRGREGERNLYRQGILNILKTIVKYCMIVSIFNMETDWAVCMMRSYMIIQYQTDLALFLLS